MKLEQLKSVANELIADLAKDDLACEIFYFFEGAWYDLPTSSRVDARLVTILEKAKIDPISYHAPSDVKAWFYDKNFSMVMSVTFLASPKKGTRASTRGRINSSITNAMNAFQVSHNQLTELLLKKPFRLEVEREIQNIKSNSSVSESEGHQQRNLAVLAFDIDKFKQVNDTYGHLFGDQVLKTFGIRLEEMSAEIQKEYGNSLKIVLGHPSGEEFLALVAGDVLLEDFIAISEKFRQKIADQPLPNEAEWAVLSKQPGLNKVQPPLLHERKITTSIGIATYSEQTSSSSSLESEALILLDRADTALYRSKAGGRNLTTHFDEILQGCGRVLEFDTDTGVVAIDIGSKVGVTIGQEFRVFSPVFSGKTPFTVDDGRTTRTLGFYPRVEIGRLVIFNVQNDISFGEVIQIAPERISWKKIPLGASLEAVPLGNISHLIEPAGVLSKSVLGSDSSLMLDGAELQGAVEKIISNQKPFVAVFRFRHEQEYVSKYGTASLNRELAKLYSKIRTIFSQSVVTGMIDRTSICVIGVDKDFVEDNVSSALAELYQGDNELDAICGYYHPSSHLPEQSAIEFARYAASERSAFDSAKVKMFSNEIAGKILSQHHKTGAYKAGIADYLRLKELGVNSADFENYAGLCYSALGDKNSAFNCYRQASDIEPQNLTFAGNFGILANRTNEIDAGLQKLAAVTDNNVKLNNFMKRSPNGYIAYALLLAKAKNAGSPNFDSERFKVIAPKALELEKLGSWPKESADLLKEAIEK